MTRTWFVCDSKRYYRNKPTELHPARYPEEMAERFVRFFSKRGMWVLDPFCGSGATLVSCRENERHAVGIELNPRYVATCHDRLGPIETYQAVVIEGDATQTARPGFWQAALRAGCPRQGRLPRFDLILGSPPYWNMLRTSRGNVQSAHRDREAAGLDTWYSESDRDLGNLTDYETFVEVIGRVYDDLWPVTRPGGYLVIVCQNLREPGGEVRTLAWDLCRRVTGKWQFCGEQVWCQNTKKLGIWGYPKIFVPNYHHHYCLILRRPPDDDPRPGATGE